MNPVNCGRYNDSVMASRATSGRETLGGISVAARCGLNHRRQKSSLKTKLRTVSHFSSPSCHISYRQVSTVWLVRQPSRRSERTVVMTFLGFTRRLYSFLPPVCCDRSDGSSLRRTCFKSVFTTLLSSRSSFENHFVVF